MSGIDYTHQHFASSIIQDANPHTPIDPNGWAGLSSISGTGGGSVANPTALQLPGVVADLGGGLAGAGFLSSLIGPFHIAHDDAQTDGYWLFGSFVADTLIVRMFAVPTQIWDFDPSEAAANFQMGTAVGGDPSNNGQTLTYYGQTGIQGDPAYQGTFAEWDQTTVVAGLVTSSARSAYVSGAGVFWADSYNGSTPLTTGEVDIYAIIATPAS